MVTFTVLNKRTKVVTKPTRVMKKNSEVMIDEADSIEYQDNDFFGRISLFGTVKDKDVVKNILFPQLEWVLFIGQQTRYNFIIDKHEQTFYTCSCNKQKT